MCVHVRASVQMSAGVCVHVLCATTWACASALLHACACTRACVCVWPCERHGGTGQGSHSSASKFPLLLSPRSPLRLLYPWNVLGLGGKRLCGPVHDPPPPRNRMCSISMGSCKQPQEIPWTLAKMQIPGPSQGLLSEPVGAGPENLFSHLPVALRCPVPLLPGPGRSCFTPLTVSDGSDTLSLGPQRPPTPCFDWRPLNVPSFHKGDRSPLLPAQLGNQRLMETECKLGASQAQTPGSAPACAREQKPSSRVGNAFKPPEQLVGLPCVVVSSLSLEAFRKGLDSHLSKQLSEDFWH